MREDDGPVIDLDLVDEGDDEKVSSTVDEESSRRARLSRVLSRPWPRPLLVAVTAAVSIGAMAVFQRPEPAPPAAVDAPVAETTYWDPSGIVPGDHLEVVEDDFFLGGDGGWVAVEPSGELLVEASEKLGPPKADPVFFDSVLGADASSTSPPLPAGEYLLEIACASRLEYVSMRLNLTTGADGESSLDVPCDGPASSTVIALPETTSVTVASAGPNAVHIGYSFRIVPAER